MQRNIIILVFLAIIGVGGFFYYLINNPKTVSKPAQTAETPPPTSKNNLSALPLEPSAINIPLITQNDSGETGVASLVEKEGKVLVVINLMSMPIGIAQPAHIHTGSCPKPGKVTYPLTSVLKGKSETVINTTMSNLMKSLPFAINIHKSDKESDVYVSCGNFSSY